MPFHTARSAMHYSNAGENPALDI